MSRFRIFFALILLIAVATAVGQPAREAAMRKKAFAWVDSLEIDEWTRRLAYTQDWYWERGEKQWSDKQYKFLLGPSLRGPSMSFELGVSRDIPSADTRVGFVSIKEVLSVLLDDEATKTGGDGLMPVLDAVVLSRVAAREGQTELSKRAFRIALNNVEKGDLMNELRHSGYFFLDSIIYAANQENPNWSAIRHRLKIANRAFDYGEARSELDFQIREIGLLLEEEKSLKPKTEAERLVRALRHHPIDLYTYEEKPSDLVRKIEALVRNAIPALIAGLTDTRPTPTLVGRGYRWPPTFLCVGDLCWHLLRRASLKYLAQVPYSTDSIYFKPNMVTLQKGMEAWWRENRAMPEFEWLSNAAFSDFDRKPVPYDTSDHADVYRSDLRRLAIRRLVQKYPDRATGVVIERLRRSDYADGYTKEAVEGLETLRRSETLAALSEIAERSRIEELRIAAIASMRVTYPAKAAKAICAEWHRSEDPRLIYDLVDLMFWLQRTEPIEELITTYASWSTSRRAAVIEVASRGFVRGGNQYSSQFQEPAPTFPTFRLTVERLLVMMLDDRSTRHTSGGWRVCDEAADCMMATFPEKYGKRPDDRPTTAQMDETIARFREIYRRKKG